MRAVVTQNDNEDLQAEASLDSGDSQKVVLLIKSGSHKGETVDAYSLNGYLYGANCKVGTRVTASLSEYDGSLFRNLHFEIPVFDRDSSYINVFHKNILS